MKHTKTLFAAACLYGLASCSNYNTRAQNDAATGALLGAGAGALIADDGNRLGGAALGGALGGAAGYAVGSAR